MGNGLIINSHFFYMFCTYNLTRAFYREFFGTRGICFQGNWKPWYHICILCPYGWRAKQISWQQRKQLSRMSRTNSRLIGKIDNLKAHLTSHCAQFCGLWTLISFFELIQDILSMQIPVNICCLVVFFFIKTCHTLIGFWLQIWLYVNPRDVVHICTGCDCCIC